MRQAIDQSFATTSMTLRRPMLVVVIFVLVFQIVRVRSFVFVKVTVLL
jgi:hypothetical protein